MHLVLGFPTAHKGPRMHPLREMDDSAIYRIYATPGQAGLNSHRDRTPEAPEWGEALHWATAVLGNPGVDSILSPLNAVEVMSIRNA